MRLLLRWFLSKQVRHGVDFCSQVHKLVRAQIDLLPAVATTTVLEQIAETRTVLATGDRQAIHASLEKLEQAAGKYLRPYPNAKWREYVEVFLVTGAVVLALRTFFFQPMAIPTGSAQPTLWGIDDRADLRGKPEVQIPGAFQRFLEKWWNGVTYVHVVARADGDLVSVSQPRLVAPFIRRQTLQIGRETYTVYFPSSFEDVVRRGFGIFHTREGFPIGKRFKAGEDVIKIKIVSGDHLFVNRVIYNFRPPKRGEIIVFASTGIPGITQDTHYIKRLVAIGGDSVRIGNDRHLVINGKRLDASTPGFENVYSFDPAKPPRDSEYSGHANDAVGAKYDPYRRSLAPLFPTENDVMRVPKGDLLAMGDNTMNSFDGRAWGHFPQEKVIGRSSFVFWPISSRFGWGYR